MKLAIEIDGLAFHATDQSKAARDYIRQRRIVYAGYVVIRFTAKEVLTNPAECWRQIDRILKARAPKRERPASEKH